MAVFHGDESEASALRAIDAPSADNPTNPIRLGGLADLEANQYFRAYSRQGLLIREAGRLLLRQLP